MTFSDIVRELEEKAAATQARLQETKKRIRTEQRASNAGNKKVQKHLEIACAVMVLSNGDLRAAVGYCSQAGLEQTSSRRYLEDRLLTGSLESLIEALCGTTQREVRLVAKARAFCSEWAVAQWVQSRNDHDGIAPSYEHVFVQMEMEANRAKPEAEEVSLAKSKSRTQWVRRFRKRWQGRYGSLTKQHGLDENELRSQA